MIKTMLAEAKNQPISFAGSIASLIALTNTYYAAPAIIYGYEQAPINININLTFIACLFFLLEGSLASVFSRLYIYFSNLGSGFPLMLMCVNAIISAGVTGYNCLWMFTDTVQANNKEGSFVLAMFIGWLISIYFLNFHCKLKKKSELLQPNCNVIEIEERYASHYWCSFFLNLFAFIFIFINFYG